MMMIMFEIRVKSEVKGEAKWLMGICERRRQICERRPTNSTSHFITKQPLSLPYTMHNYF